VGLTRHLFTMGVPFGHVPDNGGRVVDVNDLSIARVVHLQWNSKAAVLRRRLNVRLTSSDSVEFPHPSINTRLVWSGMSSLRIGETS